MKKIIIALALICTIAIPISSYADYQIGEAYTTHISQMEQITQIKFQLVALIKTLIAELQSQLGILKQQESTIPVRKLDPIISTPVIENPIIIKKTNIMVEDIKYDHFTYQINPTPVPFDEITKATVVVKLLSKNGDPIIGKEVSIVQNPGSSWTGMKSDENGEVSIELTVQGKMNNFLIISVIEQSTKRIAIPTLFEGKIWNWVDGEGGSFTEQL